MMQDEKDGMYGGNFGGKDLEDGSEGVAVFRTPIPSERRQGLILMQRNLRADMKKPYLFAGKTIAAPIMLMLYTLGFFLSYENSSGSTIAGKFQLFDPSPWVYPNSIQIDGNNATFVQQISNNLNGFLGAFNETSNRTELSSISNLTSFQQACGESLGRSAREGVCVYLNSPTNYSIFFGGTESALPFQSALAGTQWAVNNALLFDTRMNGDGDGDGDGSSSSSTTSTLPPANQTQRTPNLINDETVRPNLAVVLTTGIMHILATAIAIQFILAPLTTDKLNHVVLSFTRVGVSLQTYTLSWFAYLTGLNGIITSIALTLVARFYRLFPLSNSGLVFGSHFLGLAQLYSKFIFVSQIAEQEELAQGIPWLTVFVSMGIGIPLLIFTSHKFLLLTLLSIPFPFLGAIQYYAIYVTYDNTGFNTGVHPMENVASSGLLGNYIAQIVGILLYTIASMLIGSPKFHALVMRLRGRHLESGEIENDADDDNIDPTKFEALSPGSQVVLSVRGVCHTYTPKCCKGGEPAEVLNGLDLDICRNEVFSYLGHNGAGKTTSVKILSAELDLQEGQVNYHLKDGNANLSNADDLNRIKKSIGVCPQHNDALQETLTCRETLRLFASLKGRIQMDSPDQSIEDAIESEVERRINDIHFTSEEDADKPVGSYSGGMKRKVNIALALLGDPEVVFLDEPTAGMDPYNRRQIWDMITSAKKGRSIILLTHHLDEAEVLSDRVGILKDGKLITCGSSLFLKHSFGVGYTINFESSQDNGMVGYDLTSKIPTAEAIEENKNGAYSYRLPHGAEASFPEALRGLESAGAKNISIELTTLEEVFIETGKEDGNDTDKEDSSQDIENDGNDDGDEGQEVDLENPDTKSRYLSKIWEPIAQSSYVGFWKKLFLVQRFMMVNAFRMKGTILLNISMPLMYLLGGLVGVSFINIPDKGELITPPPIGIGPFLGGGRPAQIFGLPDLPADFNASEGPILPLVPSDTPDTIEEYFVDGEAPFIGGYYETNMTLQHNPDFTAFSLQVTVAALTSHSELAAGASIENNETISTTVQQLPYEAEAPFRADLLLIPLALGFGFAGMAFVVLDALLLKGDNIFGLFRVAGIPEWETYIGIAMYKLVSTFMFFFALVIILGFALRSVIMGNAGRWCATILIMIGYCYSTTPIGLILAKRFIKSEFKSVANWFPGVYMTFVSLPYVAWSSVLQALPDSRDTLLIIGDIICVIPQVAFQRGIGAVIEVSTKFNDPNLTWSTVWRWENRVWFATLIMFVVGTAEWWYLYQLTVSRPPPEKLKPEEESEVMPLDVSHDTEVAAERHRSLANDEGINVRDIVKVFRVPAADDAKSKKMVLKKANKGVSYGVRKNEIYCLLGPNGAGKTTAMSVLAGEFAPEHGEIALDGRTAPFAASDTRYLYEACTIAYCPQFDALFDRQTVTEHLRFYSRVRGLDWDDEATQEHIDAIIRLLSLDKYRDKVATELSGGYKRRLSLAVAMIGYPKCMMIDEVTTGVDPDARRKIWDVLRPDIAHDDYDLPAILLSTHYMQEAEELGSRIGIMIDGEIVTTGTLSSLLNRYCTSFFVEVSLESTSGEDAEDRVVSKFSDDHNMPVDVYESLPYHFKLQIPYTESGSDDHTDQLAKIFEILERNKDDLEIKFYSVAQMNLEQIFINLSRKQFEADRQAEPTSTRLPSKRQLTLA